MKITRAYLHGTATQAEVETYHRALAVRASHQGDWTAATKAAYYASEVPMPNDNVIFILQITLKELLSEERSIVFMWQWRRLLQYLRGEVP